MEDTISEDWWVDLRNYSVRFDRIEIASSEHRFLGNVPLKLFIQLCVIFVA